MWLSFTILKSMRTNEIAIMFERIQFFERTQPVIRVKERRADESRCRLKLPKIGFNKKWSESVPMIDASIVSWKKPVSRENAITQNTRVITVDEDV